MRLTRDDIEQVFSSLINGSITREEVDRWAYERMQAFDADSLVFEPSKDEEFLWEAIQYLYGIDSRISPDEYMQSIEEIKEDYQEKWCK